MALTKIKTGGITDSAVTTAKINNNAVTDAKVADAITVTAATISGSTLASGVTASSLTSVGTLTGLTVNGATVINENSADVDFRVESNDYANMLVVDGGTNQVGIGNGVASFSTGVLNITNTVVNDRADVIVDTFANNGSASALWLRTSRNTTIGTVTETASGQSIGTIFAHGVDSGGNYHYGAYIDFYQSGGSGTRVPTDIVFWSSTSSAVAEKMRITSAGTVGVGESSPSAALHVVHGSGITLPTMETTARNLAIFEGDQSENYISIASPNTAYAGINFTDTGHKAAGWVQYKHESTATNDFMRFAVNESERFRILAAGGIGIKGAFVNSASADPADYQISFGGDATTTPRWGFRVSGSSNEDLYLDRNLSGTPAIAMAWNKANGNTTIKAATLTLDGENASSLNIGSEESGSKRITLNGAGSNDSAIEFRNSAVSRTDLGCFSGSSTFEIKMYDSGWQSRFSITAGGTFAGSSSANISDRDLKENINPISNGLETINKLQGRTFEWKESTKMDGGIKYGLIAQELEEVLPDLVWDKSGLSKKEDGSYHKSIHMTGVIPVLIEAVKELSAKVTELENK